MNSSLSVQNFVSQTVLHHTMEERPVGEAVISNRRLEQDPVKWRLSPSVFMKWALKTSMWLIFVTWIAMFFLYPSKSMEGMFQKLFHATGRTFFGILGAVFLTFSAPILIIAFLAMIYLAAFPREYHEKKKPDFLRFRLRTFPVLINGPLGIVSAAELIGMFMFTAYIIWAFSAYTIQNHRSISKMTLPSKEKSYLMIERSGRRLGSIGLSCLGFLFLPIARGSILLRLIDVPMEHATKYHIWLGHVVMAIFTLHGLCYVVVWSLQGRLLHQIIRWKSNGFSYLPGVISLLTGLLMWVTSLPPVRKKYFELFYYTHQLYAIFIIFLALHVGDSIFSVAAGGIFLYLLDRFLRFCQSRKTVDIVSATILPCGTVELVLSKPRNLSYNALSFIFIRVRELSWLQWHPFSVSSSPLEGRRHLSILIKVLGEWTGKLRENITKASEQPQKDFPYQSHPRITTSVEGPYGHESEYYLTYENLILVAGGIGISPFLAILKDILYRLRENKPCVPKKVLVIWAVKKYEDLSLLSMLDAKSICPSFHDKLHLEIQTYVTQESEPVLEDGKLCESVGCSSFPMTNGSSMSSLVGTGNNIWSGVYFISSTIGFIICLGLMEAFYITPFHVTRWWFKGLLFIICMIASVFLFGGFVVILWHYWERKVLSREKYMNGDDKSRSTQYNEPKKQLVACQPNLASSSSTQYGYRPDFQEIFNSVSERWGKADIGVIVCGPRNLRSSVAAECRSRTMVGNQTIFHFNCHSFDL
ncbi:ferric reduction oxidase 6-like isoform X2 [Tasmannia lanceolata]|uniref:ferric reduction oxidase 6-like isoform X2 n=1 Tax=Tasmannia lanceolata TaxID=3420 RepID=UPI004063177E